MAEPKAVTRAEGELVAMAVVTWQCCGLAVTETLCDLGQRKAGGLNHENSGKLRGSLKDLEGLLCLSGWGQAAGGAAFMRNIYLLPSRRRRD